jgi:hypothetical protein
MTIQRPVGYLAVPHGATQVLVMELPTILTGGDFLAREGVSMSIWRRTLRTILGVSLMILIAFGVCGCRWWGDGSSISLYIPLGPDGSTGLFNPDGGVIGPGVEPPSNDNGGAIIPPNLL